jgi:DNA-binding NtrC family response regulator
MRLLTDHRWPGNVRELMNAIERAVILSDGPVLRKDLLPSEIQISSQGTDPEASRESRVQGSPLDTGPTQPDAPVRSRPSTLAPTRGYGDPSIPSSPEGAYRGIQDSGLWTLDSGLSFQDAKRQAVQSFETAFLSAALERHAGNVNQTALSLGLKRQALQQKLKELGIDPSIYRR